MAQGGDLNSLMPKGYTAKFKNKNMLSVMEGGMMSSMEFLYLSAKDKAYVINKSSKTYSPVPTTTAADDKKDVDVKITKTSETARILNYTCTKYIADVKTDKGTSMQQIFWSTKDLPGIDYKNMAKQRLGNSSQRMWYSEIEGVPLKIEMKIPQGNMIMEATEIRKQSIPESDFVIPADFKETSLGFK
jgi:outer membrane lipoprotein-sorting protein